MEQLFASLASLSRLEALTCIGMSLLIIQLSKCIYEAFFHPLSHIPGPFLNSVSSLPHQLHSIRGTSTYNILDLHHKYGPVVRIQPNQVACNGPSAWKEVYGHRAGHGGPMSRAHEKNSTSKQLYGGNSIMNSSVAEHARLRAQLNPAFSEKALREQDGMIMEHIDGLMARLGRFAEDGKVVDICEQMMWTTWDIRGEFVFGSNVFRCAANEQPHAWTEIGSGFFEMMTRLQFVRAVTPWLFWLMGTYQKVLQKGPPQKVADHVSMTKHMVDQRLAVGDTDHPDVVTFLERETKTGDQLTKGEIYAQAPPLILGGSDTLSALLTGCLYYLLTHPKPMKRLKTEIRERYSTERDITFLSVSTHEYLQAALNETGRLYHPLPAGFRRLVPSSGCEIEDHFIPGGTVIGIDNYATGRYAPYFKAADQFIPERWMGDETYVEDVKDAFQVFASGPCRCIGERMGRAESQVMMTRLLWNFDIEIGEESARWVEGQKHFVIWQKPPLWVRLTSTRGRGS